MQTKNLAGTIVSELIARGVIKPHEAGSALVAVKQAIEMEKKNEASRRTCDHHDHSVADSDGTHWA